MQYYFFIRNTAYTNYLENLINRNKYLKLCKTYKKYTRMISLIKNVSLQLGKFSSKRSIVELLARAAA